MKPEAMVITYEALDQGLRRYLLLSVAVFTAVWLLLGELLALVLAYLILPYTGCRHYAGASALYFITTIFYLVMGGAALTYYATKSFTRLWLRVFGPGLESTPHIYPRIRKCWSSTCNPPANHLILCL